VASFLIDESLPRAVGRALHAAGHDVVDARDVGLRGAADDRVLARAVSERRILMSGDVDFANALRFPPGSSVFISTRCALVTSMWPSQLPASQRAVSVGKSNACAFHAPVSWSMRAASATCSADGGGAAASGSSSLFMTRYRDRQTARTVWIKAITPARV